MVTDQLVSQKGGRKIYFMVPSEPSPNTYEASFMNDTSRGEHATNEIKAIQNRFNQKNSPQNKFYTHWVETQDPLIMFNKMAKKKKTSKILKVLVTSFRRLFIANKKKPKCISKSTLSQLVTLLVVLDAIGTLFLLGEVFHRDFLLYLQYLFFPFPFACLFNVILEIMLVSSCSRRVGLANFYFNFYATVNIALSFAYDPHDSLYLESLKGAMILLKTSISLLMCYFHPYLVVNSL